MSAYIWLVNPGRQESAEQWVTIISRMQNVIPLQPNFYLGTASLLDICV